MSSKQSNKYLFIGDPHFVWEEIEDCDTLVNQIKRVCIEEGVGTVVWLGDLHHNHSIVRLEVMNWLDKVFDGWTDQRHIILVGNHDRPTDHSRNENALIGLKRHPNVILVESPQVIDEVGYMPYVHDNQEFIDKAIDLHTKSLVCHQTIDGCFFSNGFKPPFGIARSDIKQRQIVSGHIHANQVLQGNTIYPGSSRWRDANDANEEKALWLTELKDCVFHEIKKIPSECRQIKEYMVSSEEGLQYVLNNANSNHKNLIKIVGHNTFLEQTLPKVKKAFSGARIQTTSVKESKSNVSETKGIKASLETYLDAYPEVKEETLSRIYGTN